MDLHIYAIFLVTTVMLILVPGPAAITVAGQGASGRPRGALYGVLGVACADAIFFALSATGIASLIVASSLLFSLVKWVGVAYLLYLGLAAIFGKAGVIRIDADTGQASTAGLFARGLVVQLANPKALLYFSALLPQFIDPGRPLLLQVLVMGASCVVADIVVYSLYGHLGSRLARQGLGARTVGLVNKAAGATLLATGLRMATLDYPRAA